MTDAPAPTGTAPTAPAAPHAVWSTDADARPGMSAQELVDRLGAYGALGVTYSSVPIPEMPSPDAYLDYAQWVIEEVKPHLG